MTILAQHTTENASRNDSAKTLARSIASTLIEAVNETLWPTRCAICDKAGKLICPTCLSTLPYIDSCSACPRCGAPHGHVQCSECNDVMLGSFGLDALPFEQAASALLLDERVKRIVTTYKDAGEQRLSKEIATLAARYVSPSWLASNPTVTFVPATKKAVCRRGFDHTQLLAEELAKALSLECRALLNPPRNKDQRALSRHGRLSNMEGTFTARALDDPPQAVILIDDVCTTGSTLYGASKALADAGVKTVYCLTLARA